MISDIFKIETKNLFLVPLPLDYLKKCLNGRRTMEEALGLNPVGIPRECETKETMEALNNMISLAESIKLFILIFSHAHPVKPFCRSLSCLLL